MVAAFRLGILIWPWTHKSHVIIYHGNVTVIVSLQLSTSKLVQIHTGNLHSFNLSTFQLSLLSLIQHLPSLSLFSNLTHNSLQKTLVSFSPIIDTLAPAAYLYSSPLNTFLTPLFFFAWQPAFFFFAFWCSQIYLFFSLLSCRSAVCLFWPFSKLSSYRASYLHSTQNTGER